jgi:hypothetical protein
MSDAKRGEGSQKPRSLGEILYEIDLRHLPTLLGQVPEERPSPDTPWADFDWGDPLLQELAAEIDKERFEE